MRRALPDIFICLTLLAIVGLFLLLAGDLSLPPLEDAAILMRYAKHLAEGYGIVWNIGEAPVDGATDFLLMVIIAGVSKLGIAIDAAARLVALTAHMASVVLVYLGMRRVQHAGTVPAAATALFVGLGPGLFLAASYFGTSVFVLAIGIAWLWWQWIVDRKDYSLRSLLGFSICCLIAGLIRPEGVLISCMMLAALLVISPVAQSKRAVLVFGAVFLLIGGMYFIWRWQYFGHPLPNPFYKKGGGSLYPNSLRESIRLSFWLVYPFVPMVLLSLRNWQTARLAIALWLPIIGSTLMWILLSNEMNAGGRFQLPVLILAAFSWYQLARKAFQCEPLSKLNPKHLSIAAVLLWIPVCANQASRTMQIYQPAIGLRETALALRPYADRGYTLAVSEAGMLPFYSEWRALDTWGLNDAFIAHNGIITQEYLAENDPAIIQFNAYFTPDDPVPSIDGLPGWHEHTLVLHDYAQSQGYTLTAAWPITPELTHYYYVHPEIPEHDELVEIIRSVDYRNALTGEPCRNLAIPNKKQ